MINTRVPENRASWASPKLTRHTSRVRKLVAVDDGTPRGRLYADRRVAGLLARQTPLTTGLFPCGQIDNRSGVIQRTSRRHDSARESGAFNWRELNGIDGNGIERGNENAERRAPAWLNHGKMPRLTGPRPMAHLRRTRKEEAHFAIPPTSCKYAAIFSRDRTARQAAPRRVTTVRHPWLERSGAAAQETSSTALN